MRLIDADAFKAKLLKERDAIPKTYTERYGFTMPNHFGNAIRGGIRKALRCMEQTPTIDAVPVVRCKDCKYWDDKGWCDCEHWEDAEGWSKATDSDDFCSHGDRKDGEG